MSVEQTTQLIQLILNSVLMTIACALILSRIWTRHTAIEERLHQVNYQCADLLENHSRGIRPLALQQNTTVWENRLLQAKKQLRQLQHRHTIVNYSLLAAHYALLCSVISTFGLALRTVVNLEWLIPIALGLFVLGVTVLLLAVGLTLIDLHTSDRKLWEEVVSTLTFSRSSEPAKVDWRNRHITTVDRVSRGAVPKLKTSRARVS